jgi:hypothetical protein
MYFGDYLIEKKIITPTQLILALVHQLEHLPSLIRLIHESGLVAPSELLEVMKIHIKQDTDILAVLIQRKKITEAQVNDLALKQWSKRLPLGEVLVQLNILTKYQLEAYLEAYFELKEQVAGPSSICASRDSQSGDSLINDAALESLRELGIDTSSFDRPASKGTRTLHAKEEVKHFLDIFTEKQKNKMLKLIAIIDDTNKKNEDLGNYVNSLFRDLHLIKGAIFLADISAIETATTSWDESLELALSRGDAGVKHWCMTYLAHFHSYIEKLWEIRIKIDADKTDEDLTENFPAIKAILSNMP